MSADASLPSSMVEFGGLYQQHASPVESPVSCCNLNTIGDGSARQSRQAFDAIRQLSRNMTISKWYLRSEGISRDGVYGARRTGHRCDNCCAGTDLVHRGSGRRSQIFPSIVSSAYKRHGKILETAIREGLRDSNRHRVWSEDVFRVSTAANALVNSLIGLAGEDACRQSALPTGSEPDHYKST
jgi:hypothetical protein